MFYPLLDIIWVIYYIKLVFLCSNQVPEHIFEKIQPPTASTVIFLRKMLYFTDHNRILCIRTRPVPPRHGWIFSAITPFPSSAGDQPEGLLRKKFVNRKLTLSVFSDHNYSACSAE